MESIEVKNERHKNEITIGEVLLCLFLSSSMREAILYIFDRLGVIDSSLEYTNEELVEIFSDNLFLEKIGKPDIRKLINLSRGTFNERFDEYFELNGLVGRRSFTFLETFKILRYWQGNDNWTLLLQATGKEQLAKIINGGSYKNLASEFSLLIGKDKYKGKDKFSPKEVKEFLTHIDLVKSDQADKLLNQKEFDTSLRWAFAVLIFLKSF
ncbi:MAG: hypothetical protein R2730_04710 [Chitinophagales bacterium]